MKCLNDVEIQLVADDEAPADLAGHIASCERCATRLAARREEMHRLTALMSGGDLPAAIDARVRRAIERAPARSGGATTLRADAPAPRRVAIGWLSALGTAAVVAIVVFAVLPRVGAPTTLSASEVLGRSLQSLSAASGVERLEYELIASPGEAGPHRIEHLIDHDRPGRYRLARYGPDGAVVSAASQDPVTGHRMHFVRVDGRSYVIDLKTAQLDLALPQMGKALVESAITMMQAMSPQSLSLQDTADGPPVRDRIAGRHRIVWRLDVRPASGARRHRRARLQHPRVRGARHVPEAGVRDFVQTQPAHDSPLGQRRAGRVLDRSGPWRHCHRGRWIR